MTLSHVSYRAGALASAIVVSAATLSLSLLAFASPVRAATGNNFSYYQAELTEAAPAQKEILRGVMVRCAGASCRAPIASSAPKYMCMSIAREFGAVSAFKAGDRDFTAEEIAACNGKDKASVARK